MKRKYYMRGLGVGILLTTLVFSFLNMSEPDEAEIRKRAEELGYVLPETTGTPGINLDDLLEKETPKPTEALQTTSTPKPTDAPIASSTPEPTPTVTPVPTPTVIITPTSEPIPSETPVPTATPLPSPTATNVPTPTETPVPTPTELPEPTQTPVPTVSVVKAKIHIVKGTVGSQVCRMIAAAGIVEDAEELRQYIRGRGLIDQINTGTFELSSDMTFEEITKIITGK